MVYKDQIMICESQLYKANAKTHGDVNKFMTSIDNKVNFHDLNKQKILPYF